MTPLIKICVVDDCVDEATLLCEGLKLFGYDAVAAHSGQEALQVIGCPEHLQMQAEAADKGITLVKNTFDQLPIHEILYRNNGIEQVKHLPFSHISSFALPYPLGKNHECLLLLVLSVPYLTSSFVFSLKSYHKPFLSSTSQINYHNRVVSEIIYLMC